MFTCREIIYRLMLWCLVSPEIKVNVSKAHVLNPSSPFYSSVIEIFYLHLNTRILPSTFSPWRNGWRLILWIWVGLVFTELSFEGSRWMGVKCVGGNMCTRNPCRPRTICTLASWILFFMSLLNVQVVPLEVADILGCLFLLGVFFLITVIIFLSW